VAQRHFLSYFFTPYYSHIISACVIAAFCDFNHLVKAIKITLCRVVVSQSSVLYDYFPNFIAQLPSAMRHMKIPNGKQT
jgi:hypothetical protein